MSWVTGGMLLWSLVASSKCEFFKQELLFENFQEQARTYEYFEKAEGSSPVYNFYELQEGYLDFVYLAERLFESSIKSDSSVGVWLGNKYSYDRGGWYNPRTGGQNPYLNEVLGHKHNCPCCIVFHIRWEDPGKSTSFHVNVTDCEFSLGKPSYWFPRYNKTSLEREIEQMQEQVKQLVQGKGSSVTLPEENTMPSVDSTEADDEQFGERRFIF